MKIVIIRDSDINNSLKWELACKEHNIDYRTVNILSSDWLVQIQNYDPSFCVAKPSGAVMYEKHIYDERVYFLENYTKYRIYPGCLASYIYENKSCLATFLSVNNIPHAETFVSAVRSECVDFVKTTQFPIVAKTLIGAAGSGVKILHSSDQAMSYITTAFTKGIKRRYGPNKKTGTPKKWLLKALLDPKYLVAKLKHYNYLSSDIQRNIVLFQEYIEHDFEWRCVKIGESYFAYKKLKVDSMASGAKEFEYGEPPYFILDFVRDLCTRFNFFTMAVDLFVNEGKIYVNELQTIFGHKNPFICKVNNKIGRYIYCDGWQFEEGDFNANESYNLRLESILEIENKF
ncbi:MAG: hypothetical protein R3Y15_01410 [Rikenellaceae bacterium]